MNPDRVADVAAVDVDNLCKGKLTAAEWQRVYDAIYLLADEEKSNGADR